MTGQLALRPTLLLVLLVVASALFAPVAGADRATGSSVDPDTVATNITSITNVASTADDPTGRFGTRVVEGARGDVIRIDVNGAKNHRVTLGTENTGFMMSFTVTSGSATVLLNTYKAGQLAYVGEMVSMDSGSISNIDLHGSSISAPLEPGYYPMNITFNGTESDVGAFVVNERSTNYSAGWAVPKGFEYDEETTAGAVIDAGENRSANFSIASGDLMALEVNATGLYGILEKSGLDGDDGISVEFVQRNPPPNQDPNEFTGDRARQLFTDPDSGQFFLLLDTTRHGIEPGHIYDVTFRVSPESGLVEREENLTTTFEVVERESELFYRGRKFVANASGKTTISGNATLVAGSTFQIRARNTDQHPFLETRTVTLDANSSFETTFDFSGVPAGTNFTLSIPETGLTVPAVVREVDRSTPTATPDVTRTQTFTPTPTPTPTVTPTLSDTTNTPLVARTITQGDGQPGFGVVDSIAALFTAALLTCRRIRRWR